MSLLLAQTKLGVGVEVGRVDIGVHWRMGRLGLLVLGRGRRADGGWNAALYRRRVACDEKK